MKKFIEFACAKPELEFWAQPGNHFCQSFVGKISLLLFLIAELINIQPYFYDNLKLFTYAFLFLTPLVAIAIDCVFSNKFLIPVALALLTLQSYTAIQDFIFFKDLKQSTTFFSNEELELANQFKALRRSPDSLVLIAPKHNHWIPALAGNPVLMGYPGWLWSWGINYSSRESEVSEILTGGARATEYIFKYPVEYIVVNDHDTARTKPVSFLFLNSKYTSILTRGSWHVFKIN